MDLLTEGLRERVHLPLVLSQRREARLSDQFDPKRPRGLLVPYVVSGHSVVFRVKFDSCSTRFSTVSTWWAFMNAVWAFLTSTFWARDRLLSILVIGVA